MSHDMEAASSMTQAVFSVVIPVYNCEKSIISALESVFSQTRLDLIKEILVVNDGSTDATDAVIRQYLSHPTPCPVRYFTQSNHGVSYSRNFAIRKAQAPWIALLDADDMWHPNKIARQFEAIKKNPAIRLLGAREPLKILIGRLHGLIKLDAKTLCIRSILSTPSVVFHKETGLKLGLFNESMQYCEDLFFFQKFLLCDGCYILAEDLVTYDCWKDFSGQSGLSSHLYEMHLGRNACVKDLARMGLISRSFERLILAFNSLKFVRRIGICAVKRLALEIHGGQKPFNINGFRPFAHNSFQEKFFVLPSFFFEKIRDQFVNTHALENRLLLESGSPL